VLFALSQRAVRFELSDSRTPERNANGTASARIHGSLFGRLTRKHILTYGPGMMIQGQSEVFGAISHPARRRMLDLIADGDRPVSAIAANFEMSRPAVSQHLRVLLDAGLVTEQRHGRERRYRLAPERLGPVRDWLAHYERFWDERFDRLKQQLDKGDKR
jgi:DNA-binding transcriptional ArsR family regulator